MNKYIGILAVCIASFSVQSQEDNFGEWKFAYAEYQTVRAIIGDERDWKTSQTTDSCFMSIYQYKTGAYILKIDFGGFYGINYYIMNVTEMEGGYYFDLKGTSGGSSWALVIKEGEKAVMVKDNLGERRVFYVIKPN